VKRLLIIAALIGMAAAGPVRHPAKSPRDVATGGTNKLMVNLSALVPTAAMVKQAQTLAASVTITRTNPQVAHPFLTIIYQAEDGPGSNRLVWSFTPNGPWSNSVAPPQPNHGQLVTNSFAISNLPPVKGFWRAETFIQ
jgi:hypothetical protein